MGITAHWIESNPLTPTWTLCKEVIAFRAISGPHDGSNLGRYFVGLSERAGVIGGRSTKVTDHFSLRFIILTWFI